jgi:GGDEF domain-containing protein
MLSIRARLMILALIAMVPLVLERLREEAVERTERIEAAAKQALGLARQGVAAQNEIFVSAHALLRVAANAYATFAADVESCNRFLASIEAQVGWMNLISFVDPAGRIVCSSDALAVGRNISDRAHFARALHTGEFVVSDYTIRRKSHTPAIFAIFPHRGADGALDTLVSSSVDLAWIGNLASGLAERSSSVVLIVDGTDTVFAHYPNKENFVGRRFKDHPFIKQTHMSSEGTITGEGLDGVRRIFGFVQIPGTQARLAIGFDEAEVIGSVNRAMWSSLGQIGLVAAIVLMGIWFGAERWFMRPLRALAQAAGRVGRGESGQGPIQGPLDAEFVPLAAALDDMVGQIAAREREQHARTQRFQELALIDGLTGLANRRALDERLAADWQDAVRSKLPVALLLFDIDHFKTLNDHYGHVIGDACLQAVSKVLAAVTRQESKIKTSNIAGAPPTFRLVSTRKSDFVARYGGEEFAVLLSGVEGEAAIKVAERLRRAVEDLRIPHVTAPLGYVTVSAGAAVVVPNADDSPQRLIEAADAVLYAAKRCGRNRVVAQTTEKLAISA